jgi:hydrogenase-4 component F
MTLGEMSDNAYLGVLVIPAIAAVLLAALPNYRATARINVLATTLTLICALSLFVAKPAPGAYVLVDDLNNTFIVLTTFVGWTTSIFSASYIGHELDIGRLTPRSVRFYHAMYQVLMFAMNLALIANNIGLMWVAIEIATLTTVMMVGIYRTHEALEAAWKYFILGSVGIALALFGTILVYMAAKPVVGEGLNAMVWSVLVSRAGGFDAALLDVAFVFLLLGYGTKVGLAPLHAWLPDAHAEGPTPISAVLSGLLLNVALYALLRFKMLLAANPATLAPGPLMVALGLLSLVFAAFMLYRRRDIKRLFAYSSIEHMGIITFAFGMGGPLANFAGLLHMTMHSLTKSAIFFAVGHVAQVKGTQRISEISGLTETHPVLGWGLILGVIAIAGLPPLGIFTSEFLVVSSTFARAPALALILVFGILVAFGALLLRLNGLAFGEPRGALGKAHASYAPMFTHLALVLAAGIYMPPALVAWFQNVAGLLG